MKKKSVTVKGKEWTRDDIRELLLSNDKAVTRGLSLIYSFQTADEQYGETARVRNGVGFSKFDAEVLSSMARQVNEGKALTPTQLFVARKKIIKYTRQIFEYMQVKYNQVG
jgi:hypothetical protein